MFAITKTAVVDINRFNLLADVDKEAAIRKLKIIMNAIAFNSYKYYYLEIREHTVGTDEASDVWWWPTTEPNILIEQVKLWYF